MANRALNTNIAGRVKKIRTDNFLVPLFEAISNSIHGVEPGDIENGSIIVEILRRPRQLEIEEEGRESDRPITGFVVTDNGIGFTESNMTSFCEADSTQKASIGGKGIGRFSWLKFFDRATIESVFQDGAKRKRRSLVFSIAGIDEEKIVEVTSRLYTKINISPLKLHYEQKARKSIDHVAISIVEHFIAYLVTKDLPTLKIRDGAAEIDVGDLYRRSIGRHETRRNISLGGVNFSMTGIKLYLGNQPHAAFLCADKRAAEKFLLSTGDPFFTKRRRRSGRAEARSDHGAAHGRSLQLVH